MAKMPTHKARPWNVQQSKHSGRTNDNQKVYNAARWRSTSKACRLDNPLCEVMQAAGRALPADVTDHIIRIEEGGAKYDRRNLMTMSHKMHNKKSGKERHKSILVEYILNEDGDKIPKRREDIINLLIGGEG